MILILTEKPSAMRAFAEALGGVKDDRSGTYTGSFAGCEYRILASRGHIFEYLYPKEQVADHKVQKYNSWDIDNLPWDENDFMWKRGAKSTAKDVVNGLKAIFRSKFDELVIATDVDPTGEGDMIAWEIIDELVTSNPVISRMYFVDEMPKSLQDAFINRKVIRNKYDDANYLKAEVRTKFDFLTMQFTRIATANSGGHLLRQGRLKSAMVTLVGDQLKAIREYKRVPYFENKFKDENGVIYTSTNEPKLPDKSMVSTHYQSGDVVVESKTLKKSAPPMLPDLAKLASALAPRGVSAKEVLDTYQTMYEAKIVSYPRTEDKIISPEQFYDLASHIDAIAALVGVDQSLLVVRTPRSTHVKEGGAHGANRPGPNVPKSLSELEKYGYCAPMIYEYLAKYALMMFCEDYEYENQKGYIKQYPDFKGSANVAKKLGFRTLLSSVGDDESEDGAGLGTKADPFIYEGSNPKPTQPTVKWLMSQLEKYDVGTGATRTKTYSDVSTKQKKDDIPLLSEKKGKVDLSDYGHMSYWLLVGTQIGDITVTEYLMKDMKAVGEKKLALKDVLSKVSIMVLHDIDKMRENAPIMQANMKDYFAQTTKSAGKADEKFNKLLGGKTMSTQKEKYSGVWRGKNVNFTREFGGKRFTDEQCEALLRDEEIELYDLVSAKGSTYHIKGKLNDLVYQGRPYVGFERIGFINKPGLPDSWCKHVFTDDEKKLLLSGSHVYAEDFISKKGSKFSCKVMALKQGDGSYSITIVNND